MRRTATSLSLPLVWQRTPPNSPRFLSSAWPSLPIGFAWRHVLCLHPGIQLKISHLRDVDLVACLDFLSGEAFNQSALVA